MSDAVEMVAALGGETVTFLPHNGTAKAFKAIVERQPSQVQSSAGGPYPVNQVEVWMPRDATDGVLVVQERKDKMRFKKRLSDAEDIEWTVMKLMQEDAGFSAGTGGMFRVLVQA